MFRDEHFNMVNDKSSQYSSLRAAEQEDAHQNAQNDVLCPNVRYCAQLQLFLDKVGVIDPSHPLKLLWDALQLGIIIAYLYFVPIKVLTGIPLVELMGQQIFTALIWIQVADVVVAANSGFYFKGSYQNNRVQVLKHYLRTNLVSDIVLLGLIICERYIWDYVLLIYFYRLVPFQGIVKKIEESFYFNHRIVQSLKLVKLLCFVVFVSHIFASMWMAVARNESHHSWMEKVNLPTDGWKNQVYILFTRSQSPKTPSLPDTPRFPL